MLGKGLESLIPPSKNGGDDNAQNNSDDGVTRPPAEPIFPKKTDDAQLDGSPPPVFFHIAGAFEEIIETTPSHENNEPSFAQASADAKVMADRSEGKETIIPEEEYHLPKWDEQKPSSAKVTESPPARPALSAAPSRPREAQSRMQDSEAIFYLEVDKIVPNPDQPRKHFDADALKELANSIREFGIIQPLVVRKIEREVPHGTEVDYELIAGERRLQASKLLGLERVPAVIRNIGLERERLELAMIENIQRENLNPMELARAFTRLQEEFRMTQREIASRLGKSREVVANTVRLLDLPPYIQEALEKNQITESHGRLLIMIDDPKVQKKLFDDLISTRMTTRELKERVHVLKKDSHAPAAAHHLPPELKMLQDKLSSELGAPVNIQGGSPPTGGGKITISFYSEEELRNLLHRLGGEEEKL